MQETVQHSEETAQHIPRARRQVFNGYVSPEPPRSNRPFRRRKVSTFSILLLLCAIALMSVLYISNIIAVNQLVSEIDELKTTYTNVENMNEILRSEINRKTSMERITRIAADEMGMIFPRRPPMWLDVDGAARDKAPGE